MGASKDAPYSYADQVAAPVAATYQSATGIPPSTKQPATQNAPHFTAQNNFAINNISFHQIRFAPVNNILQNTLKYKKH